MDKVFIIAEAGVNHNGSLPIAKKLVDCAVEAGCDAVKFQTFKAEKLVTYDAPKAKYQIRNTRRDESQFSMLKRLELSESAHTELASYCKCKKIIFMSTPFDEESVDFLDGLGMPIFKIPSGEVTNKGLIQHIATKRKPIILSTGMSYLKEVKDAVGWIGQVWRGTARRPMLALLHCVSNYPCRTEDVNLMAIKTLESTFGLNAGYSDHTIGIEMASAAVAIGAKIVEKHFTLDRNMSGPDHRASIEADELIAMVRAIRNVEKAIGDGVKRPTQSEHDIRGIVRRSLVAGRDIRAGERITKQDIAVKRPGTGIPPEAIGCILNKKALRGIKKDSLLKKKHFCRA